MCQHSQVFSIRYISGNVQRPYITDEIFTNNNLLLITPLLPFISVSTSFKVS